LGAAGALFAAEVAAAGALAADGVDVVVGAGVLGGAGVEGVAVAPTADVAGAAAFVAVAAAPVAVAVTPGTPSARASRAIARAAKAASITMSVLIAAERRTPVTSCRPFYDSKPVRREFVRNFRAFCGPHGSSSRPRGRVCAASVGPSEREA
jgi:hypothetical protein